MQLQRTSIAFIASIAACAAAAAGTTAPAAGGSAPAGARPPPLTAPMTAPQVIDLLDDTVDWYRTLAVQQHAADEPSDLLFFNDDRQTAGKVIALAFDLARADADLLAHDSSGAAGSAGEVRAGDASLSSQALATFAQKLSAQNDAVKAQLDQERRHAAEPGKAHVTALAKVHELEGELDLINTKKTMLDTLREFADGGDGAGGNSLKAEIDAMAVTVPADPATAPTPAATAQLLQAAASVRSVAAERFGLWDLAASGFRLSEKAAAITSIERRSAGLQASFDAIRGPLIDRIKGLSARGDALAAEADSADSARLNVVHDELDALALEFKQTSALLLPLSRIDILLGQYRRNLGNWHDAIRAQYRAALKTFGVRLALVAAILALLFGAAALWRRMVLRYVQDSRRRHQLLLVRRIALWSMVVIVVGLAFASELSSIATFAGLITAGVAVAMQSVLVSIVGYFFLIGKYGIRVGDRVQIGEVAGEVIDLGLVRMYLMELGAKGTMGPTGRVVAFANSVVFQVSSGLFKQIPGVNFAWREVVLSLPPNIDYAAVKERLIAAVTGALTDYRAELLRQTREIERTTLSASAGDANPQVQLRFAAGSVEAHVRYPVQLAHAAEIDERVTEALAAVLAGIAGTPAAGQVPVRAG